MISPRILSNCKSAGFTLLEVLVSVAILGLIMVLVWSSSSQSLDAKARIEKRDAVYQKGRVATRKISNDLVMAFLTKKIPEGQTLPEMTVSPKPITFFIGSDEGDHDSIKFTSMSHMRLFKGAKESDQCKVAYEVVSSREEGESQMNLVRMETPWLDQETDLTGTQLVLAEDVKEFNLEYYDDRRDEWVKEWNSEHIDFMGRLPSAVSMSLVFPDPDDEEASIAVKTTVLLPMSAGPVDF